MHTSSIRLSFYLFLLSSFSIFRSFVDAGQPNSNSLGERARSVRECLETPIAILLERDLKRFSGITVGNNVVLPRQNNFRNANNGGAGGRQGQGQGGAQNGANNNNNGAANGNNTGAANNNNDNNAGAGANNGDPQTSLTLDPSQVADGLAKTGQEVPAAGQVASATSTNNFINFCLTRTDLPLTNGAQVKTGSCNAVPMGVIAAQTKAPSCKFVNPPNLAVIPADQTFKIQMAIKNLVTGDFVNAASNYFSAPQNTDGSGTIIGHSHVNIQEIDSLTSTNVLDTTKFAFFKGFNEAAVNGVLSADVTGGLPAGVYRMCSINSAANHQPALVGVAQHGSIDDCVYFTTTAGDVGSGSSVGAGAGAAGGGGAAVGSQGAGAGAGQGTGAGAAQNQTQGQAQAQNQSQTPAQGQGQAQDQGQQGQGNVAQGRRGQRNQRTRIRGQRRTGAARAAPAIKKRKGHHHHHAL